MFLHNVLGGLLTGAYMGIVLGPVALFGARLRIDRGWRYAIVIALGGSVGDLLIAFCSVAASAALNGWLHGVFQFFHNHLVQGVGLILVGVLLMIPPPIQKQVGSREPSSVTSLISLFAFGMSGPTILSPSDWAQGAAVLLYFEGPGVQAGVLLCGFLAGALTTWVCSIWIFSYLGAKLGRELVSRALLVVGVVCVVSGIILAI